jgi:pimeloyl-ACP methyl ester carboxylesterase
MIPPDPHYFSAPDGVRLAWREVGKGRPVILIHGYMSDAITNWMKFQPVAQMVADMGFRVIMPDLRGHGVSERPHDPAAYPLNILASDQFALIDYLGLTDFDLGGYSLGGWTTAQMLVDGCKPGRAIISGMGLKGLVDRMGRKGYFRQILTNLGTHKRGSPEFMAEAFLKTSGGDPVALNLLLDSFANTPLSGLEAISVPVGVICGTEDYDNGSAEELAATISTARYIAVPGSHMGAVTKPEFAAAIRDYLTS